MWHKPSRPSLRLGSILILVLLGLTGQAAFAAFPCAFFFNPFPPYNLSIICKTFPYLQAEPSCLTLIDEQDVILCPPGQVSNPPRVIVAPDTGSQPVFALAMGFTHPNPSTPDDVFAVACDNQDNDCDGWTVNMVPAEAWDADAFAFDNEGVWTPPALESFSVQFPDADWVMVFMARYAGAAPLMPGDVTSLTLYGLDGDSYPYVLLSDGAVTAAGQALVYDPPVPDEIASWSELKSAYP